MTTENYTSIARPYAMADFEYALAKKALPAWEELLQTAAVVAQDPLMVRFMASPEVTKAQLADLFCDVLTSALDDEKRNFIRLLSLHNRFAVLPEITEQFKQYRAEHEKKATVSVISAVALDAEQKAKLVQKLTKRLQLEVTLECTIDPDLLGGAIIRVGDKVIDGSVRGKLHRMTEFI
jgi:F-type H+-transporting ATPase subunit delta